MDTHAVKSPDEAPKITGDIYTPKHGPEDLGDLKITPGIHVERGNLILDFSKPIQYFGLNLNDAKALTMAIAYAIHMAESEADEKPQLDS